MVSTRGVKYKFQEGEKVLCYEPDPAKQRILYDSKVLGVSVDKDENGKKIVQFLIHFKGWNSTWDRLVTEDYILKDTQENRQLQKELAERVQEGGAGQSSGLARSRSGRRPGKGPGSKLTGQGPWDHVESLSSSEGEGQDLGGAGSSSPSPDDIIPLTDTFRTLLEQDYYFVGALNKVYKVPAKPSILTILELYVKDYAKSLLNEAFEKKPKSPANKSTFNVESFSRKMNLCREIADGLRIYVDFMLDTTLLYNEEFGQLSAARSGHCFEIKMEEDSDAEDGDSNVAPQMEKPELKVTIKQEPPEHFFNVTIKEEPDQHINEGAGCSDGRRWSLRSRSFLTSPVDSHQAANGNPSPSCSTSSSSGSAPGPVPDVEQELLGKVAAWTLAPPTQSSSSERPLSTLYGAPHLARAFIKLPELFQRSPHSEEKNALIIHYLTEVMNYLEEHPEWFAESNYQENIYAPPEQCGEENTEDN